MKDPIFSQAFALYPAMLALIAALGLVALTAWKPAIGLAVYAFSISLTTGLGRGTLIPVLRVNEAILLVVVSGLVLHYLPHRKRRRVTDLDLSVAAYTVGVVVITFLVLIVSRSPNLSDPDTLRVALSPLQFLLVYVMYSRVDLTRRAVQALLNLTMLASIFVSLLAVAELADIAGIRAFIASYYPPPVNFTGTFDPGYRPISTLGHYSAVGAFAAVNYMLALTLSTMRHPAFPRLWLGAVMMVNLAGLVASLTWAPLLALPLVTALVLWYGRHVPRQLSLSVVALAVAIALLWPAVSGRGSAQGVLSSAGQNLVIPESFAYRLRVWEAFFVPAFGDNLLLGTGTVIPSSVPTRLINFVDNEYLHEGFRAGIVGVTLLLIMLITIAIAGWRSRASPDPLRRSLGAACLALVLFFAVVGLTAQYMFFAGVSQEFAMLLGLLCAAMVAEEAGLPARAKPPKAVGQQKLPQPAREVPPPSRTVRPTPSSQT
jgi:O-antigen ligase